MSEYKVGDCDSNSGTICGKNTTMIRFKVYCINCMYLKIERHLYQCLHVSNILDEVVEGGNWLKPGKTIRYCKEKPEDINSNNDCKNFSPFSGRRP
jgi:hypothetical protein